MDLTLFSHRPIHERQQVPHALSGSSRKSPVYSHYWWLTRWGAPLLELSFHFLLITNCHSSFNGDRTAPEGWRGLAWAGPKRPLLPQLGVSGGTREPRFASRGNKAALLLLPLWEILDSAWQQTALLCLAAKRPHSMGSWFSFNFIPSPDEKRLPWNVRGAGREVSGGPEAPAAPPATGCWRHTLTEECCIPPLGALPGRSANEGPKPAHSRCRRGAQSPQLRRRAPGKAAAMP